MSEKTLTFTWKISNFSVFLLCNDLSILNSPEIEVQNFKSRWFLNLFKIDDEDQICLEFASSNESRCTLRKEMTDGTLESLSCTLEVFNRGKLVAFMKRKPMNMGNGRGKYIRVDKLTKNVGDWENGILEIRCQLFNTKCNQSGTHVALIEIHANKFEFDWKITSVPASSDWSKNTKCLTEYDFELSATFDIMLIASDDKISVKIQVPEQHSLPDICLLKTSIINTKGVETHFPISNISLDSYKFETSFEKKQLELEFPFIYLFTLKCAIYIADGYERSTSLHSFCGNALDKTLQFRAPLLPLQDDLKNMFLKQQHCDVQLKVEDETILAHRSLLSARSAVFSAMFDAEMIKNQTGVMMLMLIAKFFDPP